MAIGKHAGARVILTVDKAEYAQWKDLAGSLGKPTATVMREALSLLLPSITGIAGAIEEFKDPEQLEQVMSRMLWDLVKEAAK